MAVGLNCVVCPQGLLFPGRRESKSEHECDGSISKVSANSDVMDAKQLRSREKLHIL